MGPGGESALLLADVGGNGFVSGADLTFDNAATTSLPDSDTIETGTYTPTRGAAAVSEGCQSPASYPEPAPAGPYETSLSALGGTDPNGIWRLYVVDDTLSQTGSIAGGWSIDIEVSPAASRNRVGRRA